MDEEYRKRERAGKIGTRPGLRLRDLHVSNITDGVKVTKMHYPIQTLCAQIKIDLNNSVTGMIVLITVIDPERSKHPADEAEL